jgi:hypothetical protein
VVSSCGLLLSGGWLGEERREAGGKTRREAEGLGWCRRVVSSCRVVLAWRGEEGGEKSEGRQKVQWSSGVVV